MQAPLPIITGVLIERLTEGKHTLTLIYELLVQKYYIHGNGSFRRAQIILKFNRVIALHSSCREGRL